MGKEEGRWARRKADGRAVRWEMGEEASRWAAGGQQMGEEGAGREGS